MLNKASPAAGRPQIWDETIVLGAAMGAFRKNGFGQTTMRDLEDATGLHPGSIYKAYGSKEGLFVAALSAYNERVVAARIKTHLADADDPIEGIRSYFQSTFKKRGGPEAGCLVTNTAVEGFCLETAAQKEVWKGLALIEEGLATALRRAQSLGQLSSTAPIPTLATRLLATYQGLLVLVRAGARKKTLLTITDDAIHSLPPEGRP